MLLHPRRRVRVIQLTHNRRNLVGDGCMEPGNAGLSNFGRQVAERLNAERIVVDVAHGARAGEDAAQAGAVGGARGHATGTGGRLCGGSCVTLEALGGRHAPPAEDAPDEEEDRTGGEESDEEGHRAVP